MNLHVSDPWNVLLAVAGAFGLAFVAAILAHVRGRWRVASGGVGALSLVLLVLGLVAASAAPGSVTGPGSIPGSAMATVPSPSVDVSAASPGATVAPGSSSLQGSTQTVVSNRGGSAAVTATGNAPGVVGDTPGVTATTLTIGWIRHATGASQAATLGFSGGNVPTAAQQTANFEAFLHYINSHGGVAGRTVNYVVIDEDSNSTDPNQSSNICRTFTESYHVFAVVHADEPFSCYAQHHTIGIEDDVISQSQSDPTLRPFMWDPIAVPDEREGFAAMIDGLSREKWFSPGIKLGIIAINNPYIQGMYDHDIHPMLRSNGVSDSQVDYEQVGGANSSIGQLVQQIDATILKFDQTGVTNVTFMAPNGVALFALNAAKSYRYFPKWGFSSFDEMGYNGYQQLQSNGQGAVPPDELANSKGVTFSVGFDVDPAHDDPFPATPAEASCADKWRSLGYTINSRSDLTNYVELCDTLGLLQAAGRGLDHDLTTESWGASAGRLGTSWQSTSAFPGGQLSPNRPEVSDSYRLMAYDSGAQTFVYVDRVNYRDPI